MQTLADTAPIRGVIFDFGSKLAIARAPWQAIIAEGAAALTGFLRQAGLALPPDFADLWVTTRRFAVQQADRDGNERPADDVLAALLVSQGYADLNDGFIRDATDRYFAVEDALRAPASGAVPLLAELRSAGYRLAVLSNTYGGRWVQHWADCFGFRPYLDAVVTSDEIGIRKPHPAAFFAALARMGVSDPASTVMVGDSLTQDVAGAQALGMRTVRVKLTEDLSFAGLAWPPPDVEASIAADAVITELPALAPVLERWQSDER
jgi:HAD superfamily hydrolase (TIGR01509 family)